MDEFQVKKKLQQKRRNLESFDDLISLLYDIKDNYNTDYGAAPRAIAQAALAVADYLARDFGITGFQHSFVLWDFVKDWSYSGNKCGLKIVDYDNMLFPQYSYQFDKTISAETLRMIQNEALTLSIKNPNAHLDVVKHWESILDGYVPFGYEVK